MHAAYHLDYIKYILVARRHTIACMHSQASTHGQCRSLDMLLDHAAAALTGPTVESTLDGLPQVCQALGGGFVSGPPLDILPPLLLFLGLQRTCGEPEIFVIFGVFFFSGGEAVHG